MKQDPKEVASQQKISVEEGNKIIAEFMEWVIEPGMENDENPYYNVPYKPGNIPAMFLLDALRFHSSWDWLMPVVEKIEKLNVNFNIIGHFVQLIIWNELGKNVLHSKTFEEKTKLESCWLAVIEFIQWYNENKK